MAAPCRTKKRRRSHQRQKRLCGRKSFVAAAGHDHQFAAFGAADPAGYRRIDKHLAARRKIRRHGAAYIGMRGRHIDHHGIAAGRQKRADHRTHHIAVGKHGDYGSASGKRGQIRGKLDPGRHRGRRRDVIADHMVSACGEVRRHHRPHLAKPDESDRRRCHLEIAEETEKTLPHIGKPCFQPFIFRLQARQLGRLVVPAMA